MHPLTATDLYLSETSGSTVERGDGYRVVRTEHNEGYYHGNYLLLDEPPTHLEPWVERAEQAFAHRPVVQHVCIRWDGDSVPETTLRVDDGLALQATELIDAVGDHAVRAIDLATELPGVAERNAAWDPSEGPDNAHYRAFKEGLRSCWVRWAAAGVLEWWVVEEEGEVIGQAGLVRCPEGVGRFQSVEVAPHARRRGVCSALISAMGRNALATGCQTLVMAADPVGPAQKLYRRLGFEPAGFQRALVRAPAKLAVMAEQAAHHADVRSLHHAAFEGLGEATIVDALRSEPDSISLVAVRSGKVFGHVLFSAVHVAGRPALALGPIGVRPEQQRQGVGTALIEAGIAAARERGWELIFLLGDPAYYGRFGWVQATHNTLIWDVPPEAVQLLELRKGAAADYPGLVEYHPVFAAVE